jgi:hypothetical protein
MTMLRSTITTDIPSSGLLPPVRPRIRAGTVTGGGTFPGGTSDTVTATPKSGHTFVHWTENGRVVSTSEKYTFTVSGNVTLVGDFR